MLGDLLFGPTSTSEKHRAFLQWRWRLILDTGRSDGLLPAIRKLGRAHAHTARLPPRVTGIDNCSRSVWFEVQVPPITPDVS